MDVRLEQERILIRGLTLFGHHGVRPEEREQGGLFTVDVRLDLARPSGKDELAATVDYSEAIEVIQELAGSERYLLLESFARAIADALLKRLTPVRRVRVRVGKRLDRPGLRLDGVAAEVSCLREGDSGG